MSAIVIQAAIQATVNQLLEKGACKNKVMSALYHIADEMAEEVDE